MDECPTCGAIHAEDADGFISLRRPQGIPDEAMGEVIAAIYRDLMITAALYPTQSVGAHN